MKNSPVQRATVFVSLMLAGIAVTALARSFEFLLLGQLLSLSGAGLLLADALPDESRSLIHTGLLSVICFGLAMLLLSFQAGTLKLAGIAEVLQTAFQPEEHAAAPARSRLPGLISLCLMVIAAGYQFGMAGLHFPLRQCFRAGPASVATSVAVLQRVQAWLLIDRVVVMSLPGFEQPAQSVLIVLGVATVWTGACDACRSQALRELAFDCWQVAGGLMLISVAAGLQSPRAAFQLRGEWPLPDGHETALIILMGSSAALLVVMILEQYLALPERRLQFIEDVAGLMRQHPVAGFLLSLGLLSFTPMPPLPGFWHLVAMAGSVFLPGVESTTGSAMIPNAVLLSGSALAVLAVLILSGRIIQWLSVLQHHEPRRGFSATESTTETGVLPAGSR